MMVVVLWLWWWCLFGGGEVNRKYPPQYQFQSQAPPQYQFQSQAPLTGSSGSKVSETQSQATPDEPEFATQQGLHDIDLEEGNPSSGKKRTAWRDKDDIHLLQSWLNVSKDVIVGTDQKGTLFWDRIRSQYEQFRDVDTPSRTPKMLKSRFGKLNLDIQAFTGCYKKVTTPWKSGHSEKEIMAEAHSLFLLDKKKDFKHENAWRMVKDEPKWKGESMTTNSRRQKKSADGAYTTSSDPSASIDCDEYEATQPTTRPKGKKDAKRKAKVGETASSTPYYVPNPDMLAIGNAKLEMMATFKELKTRELELKQDELKVKKAENFKLYVDLLKEDTSGMNEAQLATHKVLCDFALRELGMS